MRGAYIYPGANWPVGSRRRASGEGSWRLVSEDTGTEHKGQVNAASLDTKRRKAATPKSPVEPFCYVDPFWKKTVEARLTRPIRTKKRKKT